MGERATYNERLFAPGSLRAGYHTRRFRWVAQTLARLSPAPESVVELGCYDGKLLTFLSERPRRYLGYDADWEGGLAIARTAWAGTPGVDFRLCRSPSDIDVGESFDVAVCMDTFEHVPPVDLEPYLDILSRVARRALVATVPNEKGPILLIKNAVKALLGGRGESYTWPELYRAARGRMEGVPRREHKGFDHEALLEAAARRFPLARAIGIPFPSFPPALSFGIGIVATRPAGVPPHPPSPPGRRAIIQGR